MCTRTAKFGFEVVAQGLHSILASSVQRRTMYQDPNSHVDDNFDFIVLDFAKGLVNSGHLDEAVAIEIQQLYLEAERELKGMSWQEQDVFLDSDSPAASKWKSEASRLLAVVEAHNKSLKADAVNGAA
tara:strand:+ start:45 stop:428 length:384 start_codon:yes stop_codon:yes gene_type:complete